MTSYKLGELITQRREKNNEEGLPIRGVSREGLIPPKQIDADTSIYNVFYRGDFIFNPARMELNSIAFNDQFDKAICSSLYEVFYVSREEIVLPEYLKLIVKRDWFTRYCEFLGQGSAREYCRFANISEITVDLPDLETQKKAVYFDSVINQRIALKRRINDNLSENLYTEFMREFYSSKQATLSGNPPTGWKLLPLSETTDFQYGKMVPESEREDSGYPIFSGYGVTGYYHEYMFEDPCIVVLARGVSGTGEVRISPPKSYITNLSIALTLKDNAFFAYLYEYLANDNLRSLDSGSAQSMITIDNLGRHKVALPPKEEAEKFNSYAAVIFDIIDDNRHEMDLLDTLSKVQLSRLSSR